MVDHAAALPEKQVLVWAVLRWRSQPSGPHQHKKHGPKAQPQQALGNMIIITLRTKFFACIIALVTE
jgi:hypothetical protein